VSTFARFAPRLQAAIVARLGWTSLRPVQELAGAALLDGENAVILAPTAGGKTEASMFPTLSQLVEQGPTSVGALYVAPIKALLNNQADRLGLYTEMVGLRRFVWHGDTPANAKSAFLRDPAELLMTTPESLEVMLVSQRVNAHRLFEDLRVIVIDEVHALAGSDRGAHLMSVLERIARLSRHDVQRVGLSATVGNPRDILAWLQGTSQRPGRVVDPPKLPVKRQLLVVQRDELADIARDAARVARGQKSLFFCQSRSTTEAVAEQMRRVGTEVFVHHSAVSREERLRAEERFHHGEDACIVCTSTLELGIDVGDLDLVLQADAPDTVSSFLQRMGRTGRREGKAANTTFFCQTSSTVLQAIALIELARAGWVESVNTDDRCWPVFLHQLLAMALAHGGIPPEEAWRHLSSVPDFRGIRRAEFDRLIAWMLHDGSLISGAGRLIVGPKAEKRFGRKNFMELFAVFSSPKTYTVQTAGGQPLGTLNQDFVDRLVDGVSCFLLGGRAWAVIRVQHDDRRVVVERSPGGRQPTWGGFLPQFLGYELCQRILGVLLANDHPTCLDDSAWDALQAERERMEGAVSSQGGGIEFGEDEIRWWTFAGGRINATLRYALESVGGDWKVVPDNFLIRIRGADLGRDTFAAALSRLLEREFWEDSELWNTVADALPNYRLSKFQPIMPPWVVRETVARYLLDLEATWGWLSRIAHTMPRLLAGPGVPALTDGMRTRLQIAQDDGAPSRDALPPFRRDPQRPLVWVRTTEALEAAAQEILRETEVGLDVETTLGGHALCRIHIAGADRTWRIDALDVADLEALRPVLEHDAPIKLIHGAAPVCEALGRYGFELSGVLDTRDRSRRKHGDGVAHALRDVCARELGLALGATPWASTDGSLRPLSDNQASEAALAAEVLPLLAVRLASVEGR
jgi:ATP-dependent Lhr-like helicase